MEHQLHYSERHDNWAWAGFPVSRARDLRRATTVDHAGVRTSHLYAPYRPWSDFAGQLTWWEVAQLFGGGN